MIVYRAMELLIIRHGLPVRRELTSGAADPELSEDGRAQAEHLARYLEAERIDAVYASPLARARETAVPLATGKSLEVVISEESPSGTSTAPSTCPSRN